MAYTVIDMKKDPRVLQYEFFRHVENPWFGLTVQLDITDFFAAIEGKAFFHNFLFVVTQALNRVPELRRRILEDGSIVEYDYCSPSYTASRADHTFAFCLVNGDIKSRTEFVAQSIQHQEEVIKENVLADEGDSREHFFVSNIPWISYTHVTIPSGPPGECNPRIEMGRYYTFNNQKLLPFTVYVHHALADAWHISRFFDYLYEELHLVSEGIK